MARKTPHSTTDIVKLINELAYRHSAWQVFADFAEMAACAFSNAVDLAQAAPREQRYLEIVKRYRRDEVAKFPQMLAALTDALERETTDVMGRVYHELELHNKWAGQYFTPYPLCRMMAKMTLGEEAEIRAKLEARGFVTAQEPAVGSGAMVIALAHEMREMGINYQQHLHVSAIDVDAKCVHMAYAQFALLHIPAIIVHGNTLTLEEFGHWHTPAHILGGWRWKLRSSNLEISEIASVGKAMSDPKGEGTDTPSSGPGQLTLF